MTTPHGFRKLLKWYETCIFRKGGIVVSDSMKTILDQNAGSSLGFRGCGRFFKVNKNSSIVARYFDFTAALKLGLPVPPILMPGNVIIIRRQIQEKQEK